MTITTNGRTFSVATERELLSLLFALTTISRSTLEAYFLRLSRT